MTGVAVVGCGYWGPNVIRNFAGLDECELRAACDRNPERLADIHRRYPGVELHTDFDDVLADPRIDAVAICTPVRTHHALADAALRSGRHVLVEKPLTHSLETAERLVELAAVRGLTLMVDFPFVYSGAVQKIRTLIERQEIGELLYFDSVRVNLGLFQSDVNVIWDLAAHDLSIMTHLIGRMPRWVSATGSTHYGEHANLAYLTMKFDGSLLAHVHVNWLAPVKLRSTLIGGTKRMIVYDDLEPSEKVRVYEKGVTVGRSARDRAAALVDYRVGDVFLPHIEKTEPLKRVCRAFLESVARGTPPLTDGRMALEVVRVLEGAERSLARDGEHVAL
jgi:predicted dehydrogenase